MKKKDKHKISTKKKILYGLSAFSFTTLAIALPLALTSNAYEPQKQVPEILIEYNGYTVKNNAIEVASSTSTSIDLSLELQIKGETEIIEVDWVVTQIDGPSVLRIDSIEDNVSITDFVVGIYNVNVVALDNGEEVTRDVLQINVV